MWWEFPRAAPGNQSKGGSRLSSEQKRGSNPAQVFTGTPGGLRGNRPPGEAGLRGARVEAAAGPGPGGRCWAGPGGAVEVGEVKSKFGCEWRKGHGERDRNQVKDDRRLPTWVPSAPSPL